jgi:hypothetical protein
MPTPLTRSEALEIEGRPLNPAENLTNGAQRALEDFLFAVQVFHRRHPSRIGDWDLRLRASIDRIDKATSTGDAHVRRAIDSLRREFIALDVRPRTYVDLMLLWVTTMLLALVVDATTGEQSVFRHCEINSVGYLQSLCGSIQGHLWGYIAFRYALYGVLIGNALIVSYNRAAKPLDENQSILTRPGLNLVIGSVIAYVLARMVADGTLSFSVLGLTVAHTTNDLNNPVFHHSGMLFLIGLSACMASDVYLRRLVGAARRAAASILGEPTAARGRARNGKE